MKTYEEQIAEARAFSNSLEVVTPKQTAHDLMKAKRTISELADALKKAEQENRWISVEERLPNPDDYDDKLLWDGEHFYVGYWRDDANAWDNSCMGWVRSWYDDDGTPHKANITHWRNINIEPPK